MHILSGDKTKLQFKKAIMFNLSPDRLVLQGNV